MCLGVRVFPRVFLFAYIRPSVYSYACKKVNEYASMLYVTLYLSMLVLEGNPMHKTLVSQLPFTKYVCVCVCMCVHVRTCMYVLIRMGICVFVFLCMCMCLLGCVGMCVYVS